MPDQLRVNCVKLRPATKPAAVGNALDLLTATINHSCNPNAFVFYEGRELRARSLRKIAPGEEITICYVDPTIFVHGRRQLLQRVHFFECSCGSIQAANATKSCALYVLCNADHG